MTQLPTPQLRVEVLGPLNVLVDGEQRPVRGVRRRAALVLLALAEGRTVGVDALVDALWLDSPPDLPRQALHSLVSRLRTDLGSAAERLQTRPDGYALQLAGGEFDLAEARQLLSTGRFRAADPARLLDSLRRAMALWRGPVLVDLAEILPIATAVTGFDKLRRELIDATVESAVAAGQAADVLMLAVESRDSDPLRERATTLLMRVLAATGQPAEALAIARRFRRLLADETGLDPSRAFGRLEREIAAGASDSAAPAAPTATRPSTRLIGREGELARLRALLTAERLVTVVGPGGVGKTRLALEVAAGVGTEVLLAPVSDPTGIPHALAGALNIELGRGDVLATCLGVIADAPLLLLLDNCEHLLAAARQTVDTLLAACPRITVLATSREPLGHPAELVLRLAPLRLARPGEDPSTAPSVAVFLDRASRVRPGPPPDAADLARISDIVRRLDGMPLAIELAAGRLSTFSLRDLERRLGRSLDLVGGGALSDHVRHATLRSTIEWSYQLLLDDEQRLFRQLSLFADGVEVDTAEALAAEVAPGRDPGAVLARLVDASMIIADIGESTRFRMLETLRAFGLDELSSAGEMPAAAARHLRWAVELAAWFDATSLTDDEPEADAVLRRELANLRAAWRLARSRGDLDDAVSMITALFSAIGYRDLVEIRGWAEELATDRLVADHPRAAAVYGTAAEAAYHRGDLVTAAALVERGLRSDNGRASWHCLAACAVVALAGGRLGEASSAGIAAADAFGQPRDGLGIAALALAYAGDLAAARQLADRGAAGATSPTLRSWSEYVMAEIDALDGDDRAAEDRYRGSIESARRSGATFLVGVATVGLLAAQVRSGRVGDALRGYRDVVDYFAGTGNWTHLWVTLRNLAALLHRLGDDYAAAVIETAASVAPDAPADFGTLSPDAVPAAPALDRDRVLGVAREAVDRLLPA